MCVPVRFRRGVDAALVEDAPEVAVAGDVGDDAFSDQLVHAVGDLLGFHALNTRKECARVVYLSEEQWLQPLCHVVVAGAGFRMGCRGLLRDACPGHGEDAAADVSVEHLAVGSCLEVVDDVFVLFVHIFNS